MPQPSPLHDFHTRTGATFQEESGYNIPAHFGNPLAEYQHAVDQAVRIDLGHHTRIELTGPDTGMFLHNLCTNDVKHMQPGAGCEAFLCTAKAKVIAHLRVSRLPTPDPVTFWLDAASGQNEAILTYLKRYLISEQVELADITTSWSQILLAGPQAASILNGLFSTPLPAAAPWQMLPISQDSPGFVRARNEFSVPAFDIWMPADAVEEVWSQLAVLNVPPAGSQVLDMLRLEAGTPHYGKDMDDGRFVVEVNRTAQAISYTKGCYLGQEPIVMARDRGQVNRLLLGLTFSDATEPAVAGAKVFQGETEVGQITSSVFSPRLGMVIALAYLKRGSWEAGTTVTVFPPSQGRAATVASLPFVSS